MVVDAQRGETCISPWVRSRLKYLDDYYRVVFGPRTVASGMLEDARAGVPAGFVAPPGNCAAPCRRFSETPGTPAVGCSGVLLMFRVVT